MEAAMTTITVMGAAEARVAADQAEVYAQAASRDASRATAVDAANAAHERLVARAKELVASGAAIGYVADPVSTYSNSWRNEHGEQTVEHSATASVRITLVDLVVVGEVAAALTDGGADARVEWTLSAEARRDRTRELRGAAVADARAAAEDFAEAIGAATLTLDALRDGRAGGSPMPLADARFAMAAAPAPEVTVGQIDVRVQVEAVFTAE